MRKLTGIILVAGSLALAACGKGKGGAGGGECAAAVEHMMGLQMASMPKDMDAAMKAQMNEMIGKVKPAIIASCQKEKWSAEAISCVKGLKSAEEGKKCDDKLTKEQRDAAEKAGEDATKGAAPVGGVKINDVDKAAAIRDITALKTEMCACADAACGETVYKKWGEVEKTSEHARHDDATKTEWEKIDDELMKCKSALK
jgi:hypothetical protein